MEWRVFVPIVDSTGSTDTLGVQMAEMIHTAIADLQRFMFNSEDIESRDDDYVVVSKHVGLKFRHGKKLEIKYLKESARNGAECYMKRKFKKHPLNEQISDVIDHLQAMNYPRLEEARQQLEKGQMVTVSKSRVNVIGTIGENLLEYARIKLSATESASPFSVLTWISVAVEGSSADNIQEELQQNLAIRRFLTTIAQVNNLSAQHANATTRFQYCSILGGYPFFVQYVTGNPDAVDIEDSLLLLQSFA